MTQAALVTLSPLGLWQRVRLWGGKQGPGLDQHPQEPSPRLALPGVEAPRAVPSAAASPDACSEPVLCGPLLSSAPRSPQTPALSPGGLPDPVVGQANSTCRSRKLGVFSCILCIQCCILCAFPNIQLCVQCRIHDIQLLCIQCCVLYAFPDTQLLCSCVLSLPFSSYN